jgi:hypothetical protein
MEKYLYGASVQGIQSFIFETNKLKEIVGASALVELICTSFFKDRVPNYNDNELIIGAAGNIRYIFSGETAKQDCEAFCLSFPKKVMEFAPGITISQAVIPMQEEYNKDQVKKLEIKLKEQRNKASNQTDLGLMTMERSRRTGLSGVGFHKNEVLSNGQSKKIDTHLNPNKIIHKKIFKGEQKFKADFFPQDIKDICSSKTKNWYAVLHVDGNNLGMMIQGLTEKVEQGKLKKFQREFSEAISSATEKAVKEALDNTIINKWKPQGEEDKFPFRPIVLGGDDLTAIIGAEHAIDFMEVFLESFKKETKSKFDKLIQELEIENLPKYLLNGLTACGGMTFIKKNYPLHYGVHLAEKLCEASKKVAKQLAKDRDDKEVPSCFLFHKVHSSFISDYSDLQNRELTAGDVRFDYGPYFVDKQEEYPSIKELKQWVKVMSERNSPKTNIRNWLGDLHHNAPAADQLLQRIKNITTERYVDKLELNQVTRERGNQKFTHLFDVLSLTSIETK